jgi:hypothetical protein
MWYVGTVAWQQSTQCDYSAAVESTNFPGAALCTKEITVSPWHELAALDLPDIAGCIVLLSLALMIVASTPLRGRRAAIMIVLAAPFALLAVVIGLVVVIHPFVP